jgi:hypothetical protein
VETEKPVTVGDFTSGQKRFLDWLRDKVLLMAVRWGRTAKNVTCHFFALGLSMLRCRSEAV